MSRPSRQAAAVVSSPGAKWRHHGMSHAGDWNGVAVRARAPQLPPGGLDRLERRRRADDLARRGAHAAPRRADLSRRGEPPVEREVALGHRHEAEALARGPARTPPRRETARAGSPPAISLDVPHQEPGPAMVDRFRQRAVREADHRRAAGERLAGDERARFRHGRRHEQAARRGHEAALAGEADRPDEAAPSIEPRRDLLGEVARVRLVGRTPRRR